MLLLSVCCDCASSADCGVFPKGAVCGSDGQTYRDLCDLWDQSMMDPSVKLSHVGPCDNDQNK